jgi:hypothetical protein
MLEMEGEFEAMGNGEADLNWAKEHHDLWLARQLQNNHRPRPRINVTARQFICTGITAESPNVDWTAR